MLSAWRHIFRFRLRTLLLLTTVACVWLGLHFRSTERQRHAVAAIQKYGGWIRYDFQFPHGKYSESNFDPKARSFVPAWLLQCLGVDFFHDVVQVSLNYSEDSGQRVENHNRSDEALQYLPNFPNLRVLLLQDSQASDESMRYLADLSRLECLFMWDVSFVTDAGVAHLKDLTNLRQVHLSSSQISDKSLAVLGQLPKVEQLCLQFSYFTDEGLEAVAHDTQLTSLWVCGKQGTQSGITDAGVKRLHGLTHLAWLGIQNTQVSEDEVKAFSASVPGCKVCR